MNMTKMIKMIQRRKEYFKEEKMFWEGGNIKGISYIELGYLQLQKLLY
jgi:hypothetical protein